MTTSTLTLTEFLESCIADDEAVARAATPGPWHEHVAVDGAPLVALVPYGQRGDGYVVEAYRAKAAASNTAHIARHDPARVLAECAAKRAIVELHGANEYRVDPCDAHDASGLTIPCDTLRLLAAVYEGRDGWSEAWR